MSRVLAASLSLILGVASSASACGLGGKWISDARGVIELVIFDDTKWEHYADYRFVDGGMIVTRAAGVLTLRSAATGSLRTWRFSWIDGDAVAMGDAAGGLRRFDRLESCPQGRRPATPAEG